MELPPPPQAALRRLIRCLPLQPALHSRVFADGDVEPQPRRALEMRTVKSRLLRQSVCFARKFVGWGRKAAAVRWLWGPKGSEGTAGRASVGFSSDEGLP